MQTRMTYQTKLVLTAVQQLGHATNAQILAEVRAKLPDLSATTVHRITVRLISTGVLAYGPEINGAKTIDANTNPHDHFICAACDGIKDVVINRQSRQAIQKQVNALVLQSQLTIMGDCKSCVN